MINIEEVFVDGSESKNSRGSGTVSQYLINKLGILATSRVIAIRKDEGNHLS